MNRKFIALIVAISVIAQSAFATNFTGTANQVLRIPSGGGVAKPGSIDLSASAAVGSSVAGIANGGTGQASKTAAFDALSPNSSKGDVTLHNGTNNVRQAAGPNDSALVYDSAQTTGVKAAPVGFARNFLINGAFDIWQRQTTGTAANGATTYIADRWYIKNSLGTNGVVTFSRQTGSQDGSLFAGKVQISTAPTAAQVNGTELYQTLENKDSIFLYNKTASMNVQVKAFGNVNQIGLQFYYKTTEAKVDTGIGAESTCSVNTSTYTSCSISGQALGTSQTTAGVIGVRIRITTVSSGNTYDLNNGFQVEQAIVNIGSIPAPFTRAGGTIAGEKLLTQRYYQKSYQETVFPGTASQQSWNIPDASTVGNNGVFPPGTVLLPTTMRAAPTVTCYSYNGSSGQVANGAGTDQGASSCVSSVVGTNSFQLANGSGGTLSAPAGGAFLTNWVADGEI